jgi:hypothetical protein
LTVESVKPLGNQWALQVRLSGPPGWSLDPNMNGLELIDQGGRKVRFPLFGLGARAYRSSPADEVAWLGAAPLGSSLPRLSWPALALHARQPHREWWGTVYGFIQAPLQVPAALRFYSFERLKTEVPFELHDLPLP